MHVFCLYFLSVFCNVFFPIVMLAVHLIKQNQVSSATSVLLLILIVVRAACDDWLYEQHSTCLHLQYSIMCQVITNKIQLWMEV
jgi:hypothetical protein